jgi:pimeloyl-ACP methyl ester carboxylesterase
MSGIFHKITKKTKKLGVLLDIVAAVFTRRSKSDIEAIYARVPDPENKNRGFDLKGWHYKTAVSNRTNETYYYYHLRSKTPDAPVFLLVHGLFLDGRTFINFGPLAEIFDLVALELPHGSPFYRGRWEDFSEMLQDFIDALGLERFHLGGVSLGGQIAMAYMTQNPAANVRGLALVSTDMVKSENELRKAKRVARIIAWITRNDDDRLISVLSKLAEGEKRNAEGEAAKAFEIFQLKHPSFYKEVLRIAGDMKSVPRLSNIGVPTVIVHGDEDATVPIASARRLAFEIPNAVFKTIEGGGHTIAYTRGETISRMIRDFFAVR